MQSIREIFRIGRGPSSSHTMGPERAAAAYKSSHPDAEGFRVVLYGSLSKTGKGHGTDRVLREVFAPAPAEIVFSDETPEDVAHPNTMDFFTLRDGRAEHRVRAVSVGGGDIRMEGHPDLTPPEVYAENSFAEIQEFCQFRGIDLAEYVELCEGPEIRSFLQSVWDAMKQSIRDGLSTEGILPGGLRVERKAKHLLNRVFPNERPQVTECRMVSAYAFAVSEQNADCGTVVTAPTCGSAGVLPAVLYYMQKHNGFSDEQILPALAVAGLIGTLVKQNASISGAECGCQAEIGTACAMAPMIRSTRIWSVTIRSKQPIGIWQLTSVPFGAMTLIGRWQPWLDGIPASVMQRIA